MPEKSLILTSEGLSKLENELNELKVVRRKDVAEKIKEARGQGDLSENAEYDAAKEEQAEIEARILEIEDILTNAEIVSDDQIDKDTVSVGCRVKLFDFEFEEEVEYLVVGSTEADPMSGKISNESPIGKAIIGHHVGEKVNFESPEGVCEYEILDINI